MKKIISSLMIGLMAAVLAACASQPDKDASQSGQPNQEEQMKALQKKLDKQKVDDTKTVVVVNKQKITGQDYNRLLSTAQMQYQQTGQDPTSADAAKQIKKQTIDSLVGQALISQEADKKGYKATAKEIETQLDQTKKQYKDEKEFNEALKKADLSLTTLKSDIADSIKTEKYIDKELPKDKVTDKEIKDYYDQYAAQQKESNQKDTPKFEDVKSQIKELLEQQKRQEKLGQQVEKLKKNADVKVEI
ncbi:MULTISPECIES: SurA N-terminal domain-containing protein [Bacillus]|uniref:SurA N-terminal domain-containing protein n=1 Tax=Bacillus TaxID=1386 RepID=UPI0004066AAC|nr:MULTISPECIES: SurA N-terminal domain-containing protein [Bacillus]QHZ48790.1 peptidylprolyl isomerase [Bacillus sp. NSP9.1]WFA05570.1 SurA N-terminal domain-containing protein [Bacillus sp. HSf4]